MSRPTQAISRLLFLVAVSTIGCSVSGIDQQRTESKQPADAPTARDESQSGADKGESTTTPDKVVQAQEKLRELAEQISREDPKAAIHKMQALFGAAEKNSGLAKDTDTLARNVISRTKHAKTKQYAQQYLIFASLRNGASDGQVFKQLEQYLRDHRTSRAPIDLYRKLADQLVTAGEGSRALRFLDHGIRICANHPKGHTLTNHRKMTQQTMMLSGRTRNVSRSSSGSRSKSKDLSKLAPKTKSAYAKFKGKRPRISGRTLQGGNVSPSALSGKWTYIHFWATWCGPCRAATPSVASMKRRYEKKGVKFVGVNLDSDADAARKFIKKHKLDWPQISGKQAKSIAQSLGVNGIPVSMFISQDGKVISADRTGGDLKKQIEFSLGFEKGLEKGLKKGLNRLK